MLTPILYIGILALIHLVAYKLESLPLAKEKCLSFGGGVAVAFVFIHLLPILYDWQNELEFQNYILAAIQDEFIWVVILAGLLFFYASEKAIYYYKVKREPEKQAVSDGLYFGHLGIFSLNNVLFGYLFFQDNMSGLLRPLIFVAVAFHFITNDYAMQQHHEKDYIYSGRWVMAGAVVLGGIIGSLYEMPEIYLASVFAFLGGGVIINTLKEEMHEGKENHLGAFMVGAVLFSVVLLL